MRKKCIASMNAEITLERLKYKEFKITNFRISELLIVDVNFGLGLLYYVDVGDVTYVSVVYAASVLRHNFPDPLLLLAQMGHQDPIYT
jgi:hypothetical protein